MVFGPKRFSRWPSAELERSHMLFIVKKLSARRRLFVFTLAVLVSFTFVVVVSQRNFISADDSQMTSWHLNLNKNLRNDSKSMRELIGIINDEQTIHNEETFGASISNDSIILVVQVHKRISYLHHLIASLSQAKDISKTLLIFSHDFYDEEINELVKSIDFCRVMQIFYPYSIQTHPNEFPGTDPKDCPRDMPIKRAQASNCLNAFYPDLYGHYREASFTQMKHHWWWKLNRIFDQLDITRHHTGLLLLLEDDYYVAPDFIHILTQLAETSKKLCTYCNIMSLGTYSETINHHNYYQVHVTPWITSKHNMGMAFDKSTWHKIKRCAKYFCDYDDYNYDWSFQNINYRCLKEKLFAMVAQGPRVYHIGECGMHHNSKNCDSSQLISKVKSVIDVADNSGHLYPKNLKLTRIYDENDVSDDIKPNGGWSDLRDILLCLNITLNEQRSSSPSQPHSTEEIV